MADAKRKVGKTRKSAKNKTVCVLSVGEEEGGSEQREEDLCFVVSGSLLVEV